MDVMNQDQVLLCLRDMNISTNHSEHQKNGGIQQNGHTVIRSPPSYTTPKLALHWFDLRVFYVRVSKCVIDDDSTPENLTLNHVPLSRDTLLEVNCVRTNIFSDGVTTLLKRDRLDKRSEEITFASTDSIRMTDTVKFEVFHKDIMVLSGMLELCHNGGQGQNWNMHCDSDVRSGSGSFKGIPVQYISTMESCSPAIEVFVAGSFGGSPVILTKTLQLISNRRKPMRKGMLESIPENEGSESLTDESSSSSLIVQQKNYDLKAQEEGHCSPYMGMEYVEGEDGELSWFNAGVRVGVGIGLSICLGVGIGVGLLVRTYQGTTRNFRRRLL